MTTWGPWVYGGGNGARLGYDVGVNGQQVSIWISIQTQYRYSGDVITLSWSGNWAGSQQHTLTSSAGQVTTILGRYMGDQAYNSTSQTTFTVSGMYNGTSPSVTVPVHIGSLGPNAPSNATDTRVSDSQVNVSWSNNPTPERPVERNDVYRIDNTANPVLIAQLPGGATSVADSGLVANRRFAHHIYAVNGSGSAGVSTNYVYTTPAAPTAVSAAKTAAGDITVLWYAGDCTYHTECTAAVEETTDGGATWSPLATVPATGGTWTHVAPSTAVPHRYRVRLLAPSGLPSAWAESGTVQLLARPHAPSGLTMRGQVHSDWSPAADSVAGGMTLSWQHNPADASPQMAYEVEYQTSVNGGVAWGPTTTTNRVSATGSEHFIHAGEIPNNRTVRWRVRTWGMYTGTDPSSPWSPYAVVYTNARPTANLSPTPSTHTSSVLTARGGYLDPEGTAQSGAWWVLKDGSGAVLESAFVGAGSPKLREYTFAYRVADGITYTVSYSVRDGSGFRSSEVSANVTVAYAKPARPVITIAWDDAIGAVVGTVENPAGDVAAEYNVVYRDGVPLIALSEVPPNSTFVDRLAPLGRAVEYTATAVSALPSTSAASDPARITTTTRAAWLNGGPGFAIAVPLRYEPVAEVSATRERKWVAYDHRAEEVMYVGDARTREHRVTAMVTPELLADLERLCDADGIACYRDPDGRRLFGGVSGPLTYSAGRQNQHVHDIALTIRGCAYSE